MHCIRCGKKISEARLFCDDCSRTVSTPLEEAEVRRLILPDRSKLPPAPKPVKKAEPAPPPRGLRRLTAAVVVLSLGCTLLLGAVGYGVYSWFFGSARRARSRQALVAVENIRLNGEVDQLEEALSVVEEEQRTLEDARLADARRLQRLEDELSIYRMQTGDLETDISALEQENFLLLDELDQAAAEKRALDRTIEDLRAQLQAQTEETAWLQNMAAFVDGQVAFVSDDGTGYYHRYGCTYFSTAGLWSAHSPADAQTQGYTPCPYCHETETGG